MTSNPGSCALVGLRTSDDAQANKVEGGPQKCNVEVDDDEPLEPNAMSPDSAAQKDDGCTLFVGDLARTITERDLEKAFSTAGKVRSGSLMPLSAANRGPSRRTCGGGPAGVWGRRCGAAGPGDCAGLQAWG
jgi:hypothetical protein